MIRPTARILAAAAVAAMLLPLPASAFSLDELFGGSPVDEQLAAQVPQDKRQAINTADDTFACAGKDLELAKLKEELADRQDDLANLGTKLAKSQAKGARLALDIAKMQAIIENKLGVLEDNVKIINDLKSDAAKNLDEQTDYQRKIDTATLYVRDWTQRVANKEKDVADFKLNRCGVKTAPAPAPTQQQTGGTAAGVSGESVQPAQNDDATVIIHQEPKAQDQTAPAADQSGTESTLQN